MQLSFSFGVSSPFFLLHPLAGPHCSPWAPLAQSEGTALPPLSCWDLFSQLGASLPIWKHFLVSSSVQKIWLADVCTCFHSSSCINGCEAVTSTGFQVKCCSRVVAGDREKEGRKDCSFALSWVHRVTWDKTIPLFVVILWNGWICFFY